MKTESLKKQDRPDVPKIIMGGGKIMKINELRLGAIPLSPDILGKANIGLWAFELDEGQEPRMYVDDTMLGLVGLDHQVPPEETYHAWYDNIDKDSYDLVADAVAKMVSGEHAEVQYPWHHPDGHTMLVRCGGVRNPEYTKGIRIEGTHQNVTEVVHFDEKERMRIKQQEIDLQNSHLRADMLSFIADHDGDVNDYLDFFGDRILKIVGCDQVIFRDKDGNRSVYNAPGVTDVSTETCSRCPFSDSKREVYSEGVVIMNDCRKGYKGVLPDSRCEAKSSVMLRVYTNSRLAGLLSFHYLKENHEFLEDELDLVKLLSQYLGLFLGRIEAKRLERLTKDQYLNNFIKNYNMAYKVNLNDDTFEVLKFDKDLVKIGTDVESFSELIDLFISTLVFEPDREMARRKLHPDYARQKFSISNSYTIEYRVRIDGKVLWNEMILTELDAFSVAVGVLVRDQDIVLNHLKDKQTEDYYSLFSIDLDSELLTVRISSAVYPTGQVGDTAPFTAVLGDFAARMDGEVCDFFKNLASLDYLKRAFASEDKLTYSYKSKYLEGNKWVTVTVYVIARHEDGSPSVLTLGFSQLDTMGSDRQEMQNQIADALRMAQSANNAKTLFLNSMSHDIRTPMNAILGYTSMAKKHLGDRDRVVDYLNKIGTAGNNLLELVNQVLDMSRIESGKVELSEDPVDVVDKVYEMVEIFRPSAEAKNIKLSAVIGHFSDRKALVDCGRVNQLIMNILGNAIKYTPEGGCITYSASQLECDRAGYGNYLFAIKDNGIGISREYLDHIFEPFSRESSSTVSKIQGTGLGMSIVKKLVDLLAGSISIESEQGKGTTISVTLPFRLQEDIVELEDEVESAVDSGFLKGKRVLLVEDNEMNREIATMLLEEYGVIVETAEDGDIAVEKVKEIVGRGDWKYFDAILMDVQMPRMNGYDATRAIRAIPGPDDVHLPIIAMTANAFAEDRKLAMEAGMDEHIAKPIDAQNLWETLAKMV